MSGHGAVEGGMTQAVFEAQRREIAIRLLKKTDDFVAWDLEFNKKITELMGLLIERLRENPSLLDGSANDLLTELAALRAGEGKGGGDIAGGSVWDDIFGVIKEVLLGEKEFIESLISKIFGL
ncbi:MAG: hypothetical protein WDM91_15270 [Rhizomicrobium sp.]